MPERFTVERVSEIPLSGGEISILKTIGLTGGSLGGNELAKRVDMETAELIDSLDGLVGMGYVLANKSNVRTMEDVERSSFRVNPAFGRQLRDAVYPSRTRKPEPSRRRRRS